MEQLMFKDLIELFEKLKEKYSVSEILEMPIYIGDDEELNGIHTGFCVQEICKDKNHCDDDYFIEMIEENCTNVKFNDKAILIS